MMYVLFHYRSFRNLIMLPYKSTTIYYRGYQISVDTILNLFNGFNQLIMNLRECNILFITYLTKIIRKCEKVSQKSKSVSVQFFHFTRSLKHKIKLNMVVSHIDQPKAFALSAHSSGEVPTAVLTL